MALLEKCRLEIYEFNGCKLLIDFLNERPCSYISPQSNSQSSLKILNDNINTNNIESEMNACERVQQKSAIAISRFCKEAKYSNVFVELGGISFFVFLFLLLKY
jgi:hypothetical protein